jgi:tetrahydromethanopterin S-methyltransferase subunit G
MTGDRTIDVSWDISEDTAHGAGATMSDHEDSTTDKPRSFKKKGLVVGLKVVSRVFEDPDRAKRVMDVVNQVQRGKARLDQTAHRVLNAGNIPSLEDLERIGRHVGALRREMRRLKNRLEAIRRKVEAG